jgi:hypothetical protein
MVPVSKASFLGVIRDFLMSPEPWRCCWPALPGSMLALRNQGPVDATPPEKDDGGGAVLKQFGKATYPLALREGTNVRDGFVEVKFKPISGSEDRAGGIVWRAKDPKQLLRRSSSSR